MKDNNGIISWLYRFCRDIALILVNLRIINIKNVPLFFKLRYFKSNRYSKAHDSMHTNNMKFLVYKQDFLFEMLLKYWKKDRFFSDISNFIELTKPDFKNKNVLDLGCGYSSVLNLLPDSNRYGVDIIIPHLKAGPFPLDHKINWIPGFSEDLPFKDNFFDIIFCSNAFDHFEEPEKSLIEIRRVLKDKGLFILIVDVFDVDSGFRDIKHPHSMTERKILDYLKDFEIKFQRCEIRDGLFSRFLWNNINNLEFEKKKMENSRSQMNPTSATLRQLVLILKNNK